MIDVVRGIQHQVCEMVRDAVHAAERGRGRTGSRQYLRRGGGGGSQVPKGGNLPKRGMAKEGEGSSDVTAAGGKRRLPKTAETARSKNNSGDCLFLFLLRSSRILSISCHLIFRFSIASWFGKSDGRVSTGGKKSVSREVNCLPREFFCPASCTDMPSGASKR